MYYIAVNLLLEKIKIVFSIVKKSPNKFVLKAAIE